jgi:branched-chain amino acid transport system permease protein
MNLKELVEKNFNLVVLQRLARQAQILLIDVLWVFYKVLLKIIAYSVVHVARIGGSILLLGGDSKAKHRSILERGVIGLFGLIWGIVVIGLWQTMLMVMGSLAQIFGLMRGEYRLYERIYVWIFPMLLLIGLPFMNINDFLIFQVSQVFCFAIILLGLNIVSGYGGQISFGHSAFVLLGAYACALTYTRLVPEMGLLGYLFSVLCGGVFTGLVGLIFGLPTVRVKGPYLGIMTMGMAIAVPAILSVEPFCAAVGGMDGIYISPPAIPTLLQSFLKPEQWNYLIVLFIAMLAFVLGNRILKGQIGRVSALIRQEEEIAPIVGVNVVAYKVVIFAISAFYAGIGGAALLLLVGYINPETYSFADAFNYFVALCIGGFGSILGTVLGAIYLTFRDGIISSLSNHFGNLEIYRGIIFGCVLLVFILGVRTGLAGEIRRLMGWWFFSLPKRGASQSIIPPDLKADELGLNRGIKKDLSRAAHSREDTNRKFKEGVFTS